METDTDHGHIKSLNASKFLLGTLATVRSIALCPEGVQKVQKGRTEVKKALSSPASSAKKPPGAWKKCCQLSGKEEEKYTDQPRLTKG